MLSYRLSKNYGYCHATTPQETNEPYYQRARLYIFSEHRTPRGFHFLSIVFFAGIFLILSYTHPSFTTLASDGFYDRLVSVIYYSSALSSNTGVGDLGTVNTLRVIAIIEMFLGIFLFAFIIAKLTSRRNDEILKNLYEMEIETNYRNFKEETFISRKRLDAILTRSIAHKKVINNDVQLLSVVFLEISIEMNISPKLLLNIGDDSSLDRKRQEVIVYLTTRTLDKLHTVLRTLNSKKYFWANKKNLDHLLQCRRSIEKYFDDVHQHIKKYNETIYNEIMESKEYLHLLETDIEHARLSMQ